MDPDPPGDIGQLCVFGGAETGGYIRLKGRRGGDASEREALRLCHDFELNGQWACLRDTYILAECGLFARGWGRNFLMWHHSHIIKVGSILEHAVAPLLGFYVICLSVFDNDFPPPFPPI